MSHTNKQFSETNELLEIKAEVGIAVDGTTATEWYYIAESNRAVAIVQSLSSGGTQTTDTIFEQAQSAAGLNSKPVHTGVLSFDADGSGALELLTDRLDINNGFSYIRAVTTNTGEGSDVVTVLFGYNQRNQAVTQTAIKAIATVI